jgi:hypothetical protein
MIDRFDQRDLVLLLPIVHAPRDASMFGNAAVSR